MSLSGLISGSDCALPNNPLSQVLKHADGDRSVQRDRLAGPSSSRLQYLPSSSSQQASTADLSSARRFFDGQPSQSSVQVGPAQMHNVTQNTRPLDIAQPIPVVNDKALQEAWMRLPLQSFGPSQSNLNWSAEFMHSTPPSQMFSSQTLGPQSSLSHSGPSSQFHPHPSTFYRSPYGMQSTVPTFGPAQVSGKGKEKARDDAFEAAFAQLSLGSHRQETSARIEELMNEVDSQSLLKDTNKAEEESASKDVEDIEDKMRQVLQNQYEDIQNDYGTSLQEAWENGMGMYDNTPFEENQKFDNEGIPIFDAYEFEKNNKYLSQDAGDFLAQAKQLLESNGSLTEVACLLEAAIQKGQLGEGEYEAWILLGDTRCMDEREEAGMKALLEGARRAEESGEKGIGLMSLATAFTNEGYERGSHAMLLRWLSARYPEHALLPDDMAATLRLSHWASRERVTEAFLSVARAQHAEGTLDPDVQSGLGVLFYISGDFTRAQDCFSAALSAKPKDFMLWNRLGSALSNGNKPEEALGAYREALQLRPTYTRAIYNVGVACLNIGATKEAAEHFLSALSMQDASGGEQSEQLWFTLRRALIEMGRQDLSEKAGPGADIATFRREGFDF